jgi:hypothetical protein
MALRGAPFALSRKTATGIDRPRTPTLLIRPLEVLMAPNFVRHVVIFRVHARDLLCTAPARPKLAPQRVNVAGFMAHQLMSCLMR